MSPRSRNASMHLGMAAQEREAREGWQRDRLHHETRADELEQEHRRVRMEVSQLSLQPHTAGFFGEPEPEEELPPTPCSPRRDPPLRIWVGSWNAAVNEIGCEDLRDDPQRTFAAWVPPDKDVYVMGLQEGSSEEDGEYFYVRCLPSCPRPSPSAPRGPGPSKARGAGGSSPTLPKYICLIN